MFMPPSTPMAWPVMKSLSSEARKITVPTKICGILIALKSAALSAVGELFGAGDAFLIWAGDGQAGHDRVHADIVAAHFSCQRAGEAEHAGFGRHIVQKNGVPLWVVPDEMLMILPFCCCFIAG